MRRKTCTNRGHTWTNLLSTQQHGGHISLTQNDSTSIGTAKVPVHMLIDNAGVLIKFVLPNAVRVLLRSCTSFTGAAFISHIVLFYFALETHYHLLVFLNNKNNKWMLKHKLVVNLWPISCTLHNQLTHYLCRFVEQMLCCAVHGMCHAESFSCISNLFKTTISVFPYAWFLPYTSKMAVDMIRK